MTWNVQQSSRRCHSSSYRKLAAECSAKYISQWNHLWPFHSLLSLLPLICSPVLLALKNIQQNSCTTQEDIAMLRSCACVCVCVYGAHLTTANTVCRHTPPHTTNYTTVYCNSNASKNGIVSTSTIVVVAMLSALSPTLSNVTHPNGATRNSHIHNGYIYHAYRCVIHIIKRSPIQNTESSSNNNINSTKWKSKKKCIVNARCNGLTRCVCCVCYKHCYAVRKVICCDWESGISLCHFHTNCVCVWFFCFFLFWFCIVNR